VKTGFCRRPQRGSLILVVMCLLAVLGIALASYLAVSNSAMKLSNRSFQTGLSEQLAEMGLSEALRAFNNNNWVTWTANSVTATWSDNGTSGKKCTIIFPAGKFGPGVTATVKIRVDNYNVAQLNAAFNSSANYLPNNLVGYTDGNWYRAIASGTGKTPSTTNSNNMYWLQELSSVSAAMTWVSGTSYVVGNMVLSSSGNWYRCKSAHTAGASNQPPSGGSWGTYWIAVPYLSADADLHYTNEAVLNYYGSWYRYLTSSGWDGPLPSGTGLWSTTWRWTASTAYAVGNVVWNGNVWYRCKTANSDASFTASHWDTASTLATSAAASWAWSSTLTYNLNDAVYYSSRWYRSLTANNINNTPSTISAYWSVYPLLSQTWDSGRQYSANDTAYYNGVWYLSLLSSNYGQNPATATSYWIGANTTNTSYTWNSTSSYSAGNYRCYGGVWYKCLTAGSGNSPNNSSNWTPIWAQSSGASTGAPVVFAEGSVTLTDSTAAIKTQLRATLAPASLFPNAIAATSDLTISGAGTVDSYDSTLGTYASQTPGYSAVLAAGDKSATAVTISGTTIQGYVAAPSSATSPYAPLASFGTNAVVKSATSPTSPKVDPGRLSRSPFIPQFDIHSVPQHTQIQDLTSSPWPSGGLTLGTPGATTPSVYYYSGNLAMSGTNEYLTIVGPVIIDVQGNLRTINSYNKITIAGTGSVEIHVSGRLRIDSGGGGIDNQTLDPKKCVLLCTATGGVGHNFSTATPFYGVIYMPSSSTPLTVDTGVVIYGALSAQNITFSNEATLHYDTSLRYAVINGVDQPYAVADWRELTDAADRITMP